MNIQYWKNDATLVAATTLQDQAMLEANNLALHVSGNIKDIIANRQVLCDTLKISLQQWVLANQTHSDHVYKVEKKDQGKGSLDQESAIRDCDALYTFEQNLLIGVFTADCVPLLLYDESAHMICAIHSGWQGTVKEITKKVLHQLIHKEHLNPANFKAIIGPSINYEHLEVGLEVVDQVKAMSFDTTNFITYKENGKALIDNKGLNKVMLLEAGVKAENIIVSPLDTLENDPRLFSYRRNHACGRHLSFIMMK